MKKIFIFFISLFFLVSCSGIETAAKKEATNLYKRSLPELSQKRSLVFEKNMSVLSIKEKGESIVLTGKWQFVKCQQKGNMFLKVKFKRLPSGDLLIEEHHEFIDYTGADENSPIISAFLKNEYADFMRLVWGN